MFGSLDVRYRIDCDDKLGLLLVILCTNYHREYSKWNSVSMAIAGNVMGMTANQAVNWFRSRHQRMWRANEALCPIVKLSAFHRHGFL